MHGGAQGLPGRGGEEGRAPLLPIDESIQIGGRLGGRRVTPVRGSDPRKGLVWWRSPRGCGGRRGKREREKRKVARWGQRGVGGVTS